MLSALSGKYSKWRFGDFLFIFFFYQKIGFGISVVIHHTYIAYKGGMCKIPCEQWISYIESKQSFTEETDLLRPQWLSGMKVGLVIRTSWV